MSINTASNLFITSSFGSFDGFYQHILANISSFQEVARRVIRIAEHARLFRQHDAVNEAAHILINLPSKQYQAIGHYYLGWCESMKGDGARATLERVAEYAPAKYRALAMQSLAAMEARKQDYESELSWLLESMKTYPSVDILRGIAVVKAKEGYNKTALKDLENLVPLLQYTDPFVCNDCLNSLAVEYGEAGRKYEARNVIRHVLESPLAIAYPEWRETGEDLREANRSFVVIDPSPLKPRNVLTMPTLERDGAEFPAWAGQPAPVVNYQKWKRRMGKKKKRNGKPNAEDMDTRDMLFRIMEIYCNDETTEEQRVKMWEAVEKIAANEPTEPDTPEDPDDDKLGA